MRKTSMHGRVGETITMLLASVAAQAACTTADSLDNNQSWSEFRRAAIAASCDPYFVAPFREADEVDIAVIGRAVEVTVRRQAEFERAGTYSLEIERVLYGSLTQQTLVSPFHSELMMGDEVGIGVPAGRAIIYLRRTGAEFQVLLHFPCN